MDREYEHLLKPDIQKVHINVKEQRKEVETAFTESRLVDSPVTRIEAYCLNTVLQALSSAGLKPKDDRYMQISRATAKLVIRDRKAIWIRYRMSKEGLKEWILWKVGLRKNPVFEKMKRMGLTGDVQHDMEVLKCLDYPAQMKLRFEKK